MHAFDMVHSRGSQVSTSKGARHLWQARWTVAVFCGAALLLLVAFFSGAGSPTLVQSPIIPISESPGD